MSTKTPRATLLLLPLAIIAGACGDDPKKRLGETCSADFQCESGLCLESRCVDPDGDEDDDGLVNRIEGSLGTNPLLKDSDADGVLDLVEVGDAATPLDSDDDGFIDAVESALADADDDCVPDQRDPANLVAETDLATVAELACCCQGACSDVGVSPTATCTGGVLSCDPAQPDRDGDRVADACDAPLITLEASEIEAGCSAACADIATSCDGAPDACVADCVERTSGEGLWLANYVCLAATCSEAACFEPPGFAEDAACREACGEAVGCGLGAVFGATFSEASCRAQCAGEYEANNAAATSIYACLAGLQTSGACRLVDALPCVIGPQLCTQACGKLVFPPTETSCRIDAPIYDAYPTEATCTSDCTALGGFGEVAFLGCASIKGCSVVDGICDTNPNVVATGCELACEALATTCELDASPFADASLCGAFCTGITQAAPWITPTDATQCIAAGDACDTGDEAAALLTSCLLQTTLEPRCVEACERIETCAAELERPAPPDCELGCTGLVLSHPERIEPTLACIDEATICTAVIGCLPPSPEDVCTPACTHLLECNPNYLGGLVQCQADCRADIGADVGGLDRYAAWMCEALAPSCDIACGDLPNLAPDAECIAACEGTDVCIEAAYGLCPRACQGARRAYGEETSNTCVLENLARRCNPIAVKACNPS